MALPKFVRFVLWCGPRKSWFIAASAVLCALVVVATFVGIAPSFASDTLMFLSLVAGASALGGMLFGWFMWELFIWPTLAAYPGSPELPPNQRPKEWQ